jgi:hypothetical protein
MVQFANGPYLQAAFFCERLLEEADGVLSAIRIVDTVTIWEDKNSSEARLRRVDLTLFIAFKSGGHSRQLRRHGSNGGAFTKHSPCRGAVYPGG